MFGNNREYRHRKKGTEVSIYGKCSKCGGHFVTHPHEIARHYVCGLCNPPARAGKGRAAGALQMH